MDVESIFERYSIDKWFYFEPRDEHYCNFPPHVIFAAHKIADVYQSFTNARFFLGYMNVENYGELIAKHDDLHLNFIRSRLLQSALSFYNYSIDLSWQVLWLYYGPSFYSLYDDPTYYYREIEKCNRENLKVRLHLAKADYIMKHVDSFIGESEVSKVRKKYNYLKHRGTFYTPGVGKQQSYLMGAVDGRKFKMIKREVFDIDEWTENLINFDVLFFEYFEEIINWIMPRNYQDVQFNLVDILKLNKKIEQEKEFNEWQKSGGITAEH